MSDIQNNEIPLFPAHINKRNKQSCQEHCLNTAIYAENSLKDIGLGKTAYLAGLLHDCGKYSKEFSDYIEKASQGKDVIKGSVIHTFAGVYYMLSRFHDLTDAKPYDLLASELIAYAIGAHHGLFDCINEERKNGFVYRLNKQPLYEQKAIANYNKAFFGEEDIAELFEKSAKEVENQFSKIQEIAIDNQEICFYIGLISRMLCSALIDSDRRDTAEFMADAEFNKLIQATSELWNDCTTNLEKFLKTLPDVSEMQQARKDLSDLCKAFADKPSGIYRLNVPTGGGKTLSSLRYALAHAAHFKKKRIVYTAPLISILEQNTEIIRKAIGNDEIILEHHSNIIRSEKTVEEVDKYDLLAQTWNAPIIVTTLVQLLNTLFSSKTSSIRRFQSLCDSVIIVDEVQTVPIKLLALFNLTLNYLNRMCGATIILCSATQPPFEKAGKHKMLVSNERIIPEKTINKYKNVFRRTELIDEGNYALDDIHELVESVYEKSGSLLVICNTRREAAKLFSDMYHKHNNCYHLSASMCKAHRKKVLKQVNKELVAGNKLIVVSTQVIEAGVDISFDAVIRLTAGIDNIVQAAGRCNRNGENDRLSPVHIVRCKNEPLGNLVDISRTQDATNNLLGAFSDKPELFNGDLSSDEAIKFYYQSLYNSAPVNLLEFPTDHTSLFNLLSDNQLYFDGGEQAEGYIMHQAFKTAGGRFEIFDRDSESMIVPYEHGQELIAEMQTTKAKHDLTYMKNLLEQAKDYTVSVYRNEIDTLISSGAAISILDGKILVLLEDWYDNRTGLNIEPVEKEVDECNILIS